MRENNTKFITTLMVLALASAFLGSVFTLAPLMYAQVPFVPGQMAPPTKANVNVTTSPTKPASTPVISRMNLTTASGTIASLQNDQIGKPHGTWYEQFVRNGIWLLSGKWTLFVPSASANKATKNVTSPTFNAAFSMVLTNGTAKHSHKISDFRMIGSPVVNKTANSTTFRGMATVSLKDGPHTGVPVVITLENGVLRIAIDRLKTDDHFGTTPIFGTVTKLS
jgi:hypothetical protein